MYRRPSKLKRRRWWFSALNLRKAHAFAAYNPSSNYTKGNPRVDQPQMQKNLSFLQEERPPTIPRDPWVIGSRMRRRTYPQPTGVPHYPWILSSRRLVPTPRRSESRQPSSPRRTHIKYGRVPLLCSPRTQTHSPLRLKKILEGFFKFMNVLRSRI
jgi:hypothetical protein